MAINNRPYIVDKRSCTCDCWDGAFKIGYDRGGYKMIYFNMEFPTLQLFLVTWAGLYLVQRTLFNLFHMLIYRPREIRWRPAIAMLCTVWPAFYGWWNFFNSINDQFFGLFCTQLSFTLTEIAMSIMSHLELDSKKQYNINFAWPRVSIALWHIIQAGMNEWVWNLLNGAAMHKQWRDISFIIMDLAMIVLTVWEMRVQLGRNMVYASRRLFLRIGILTVVLKVTFDIILWMRPEELFMLNQ
eukprot:TRINITY_DN4164_c1_g1_i1.p1 TRINITY_DN4164_c1_g1~~TRINITY_DN4164_c1_g1_i1.p1  ORF type:complete len:242 (-),score=35.34 TRINITY_DN4164_c1_g1_i1:58-783(-)